MPHKTLTTEKIQEKIKNNQKYITTNEDLSGFGYIKHGKSRNGTIRWINEEYYQEHELGKQSKEYYRANKEERIERIKEYYNEHSEERKNYQKKRYSQHKEKVIDIVRRSQKKHLENFKIINARHSAKRKRELGYEPINKPFEGAVGHHLTKDLVVYIPGELHRSVKHNIFTEEGIEEINLKALNWLKEELNGKHPVVKSAGKKKEEIIWEV